MAKLFLIIFTVLGLTQAYTTMHPQIQKLVRGQSLAVTEYLSSGNGYYAVFQPDGNFVIYKGRDWIPQNSIWASNSFKIPGAPPAKLVMQEDGNLVMYDWNDKVIWATGTQNKGFWPYKLVMQENRNLVLYDGYDRPMWASNTRLQK